MSETDSKEGNGNGTPQVGALLRASRLRVGEDLREIADILCIRYIYLEAIEEGRYGDLPGDTYAVGFIRSYSEHLGLDGEEVIRRFKAERAGAKRSNDLSFPTPVPESGMPKGAIVFIGVLLALLVYGGWYVTTTDESILSDLISPVPDHLKHLVDGEQAGSTATPPDNAGTTNNGTASETQDAQTSMTETAEEVANRAAEAAREAAETASGAVVSATEEVASAVQPETPAETTPETPAASEPAPSDPVAATPSENAPTETAPVETASPAPTAETPAVSEPTPAAAPKPAPVETATAPEPAAEPEPAPAPAETTSTPEPVNETATPVEAEPAPESAPEPAAPETAQTPREPSADELNARSLANAAGSTEAPAPKPAAEPEPETASAPISAPAAPQQTIPTTGTVIRAVETSWVEVRDPANSRILYTGLMSPGAIFEVPDQTGLVLDTGNAGGLDIIVDGQRVPKLGDIGAVRKSVSLDAGRLKAGTATSR